MVKPIEKMSRQYQRIAISECQTCIWSKQNPKFGNDLVRCNYFNVNSMESIADVMWKYRCPLVYRNVVRHCKNHLTAKAKKINNLDGIRQIELENKEIVIDKLVKSGAYHEQVALDTVKKYHALLKEDQIKLTAKDGLTAIKLLADIERSNKDRGADLFKTMFKGAEHGVGQQAG